MIHTVRSRLALAHDQRGITLVELLIVVVIVAILLGVAITSNIAMRQRASDVAAQSLLYEVVRSIETYHVEHGTYTGMTPAGLQADYDRALNPASFSFGALGDLTYCVQATSNGETWRKNGPGRPPENLPCP